MSSWKTTMKIYNIIDKILICIILVLIVLIALAIPNALQEASECRDSGGVYVKQTCLQRLENDNN